MNREQTKRPDYFALAAAGAATATATPQPRRRFIGYREAARMLGYTVNGLYAAVYARRVPCYRVSPKRVLFDADELERFILSKRVAPVDRNDDADNETA